MSVNNYKPHLLVLPEDDANRQLANGFALEVLHGRKVQVLPEAGGWVNVCELFLNNQQSPMRKYLHRHVVLLLDFDGSAERRSAIESRIPSDLKERVFLLGVQSEPEALLRARLGTLEDIGRRLAAECRESRSELWHHALLNDNAGELARLAVTVRPFLFDAG